jgi:hypothetical protein
MTRITVDSELLAKLGGLSENIELCDEQGTVLAFVNPLNPKIDWDKIEWLTPDISPEETRQRLESDEPRYTTQQVLDKLRDL